MGGERNRLCALYGNLVARFALKPKPVNDQTDLADQTPKQQNEREGHSHNSIGTLVDIDPDSREVLRTLEGPGGGVALVFSPDGRYLAGVGLPGAVLWDLSTNRIVRRFQGNFYRPTNAAFINDGGEILIASGEGMIRRYLTDPLDLVELARSEAIRELKEAECQLYMRSSCDG